MSNYRIFKYSTMWSTNKLVREVEERLQEIEEEGYEIISVAFGTNMVYSPTAFITVRVPDDEVV